MRSFFVSTQLLQLMVIAALSIQLVACGGCKKKSGGNKGSATTSEPEPTPTETPKPTPTVSPEIIEDIGEETPPITPDKPITIDTDKKAAVRKLIFSSSDTTWAGRHTTEYLIAIRSIEDSCVRIKMRPTDGLTTELDDKNSEEQGTGRGACEELDDIATDGSEVIDEEDGGEGEEDAEGEDGGAGEDVAEDTGDEGDDGDDGAALWGGLDYISHGKRRYGPLRSTDPDATTCAPRLFRMPILDKEERVVYGLPEGLDDVVTKTGRLLVKGSRVRIWVDEEFSNVCTGGAGGLNDVHPIEYAPWIQRNVTDNGAGVITSWIMDQADQLRQEHLDTLAADIDKIYNSMTKTYGPISDIDSSGFIEIFLTPEINRTNFTTGERLAPDDFRAQYLYRPQDLAYYNPESNPISNEGEILYLWSPDPAGIYNPNSHPSANSITSNYARGFLASQLMNLVYINERLIKRTPAKPDEPWLISGLAQLASAYYAGIDFTKLPLAHYMTGRGQNLSLTDDGAHLNETEYAAHTGDEVNGMRTMFLWYLHARVCKTTTVTPCSDLKKLLTSEKSGKANVEALLGGEKFKVILANFGLAVGVSLVDSPSQALGTWENLSAADAKLMPPKPQILPDFAEVYKSNPHHMAEIELKASAGNPAVIDLRTDIATDDRTQAAPFPSKRMLMFQPITTDNEIEFRTAKDSVSYVLVTGLIEQETQATAMFGKGLNVTFIPIGDLDQTKRKIHFEKLSENAIADLRPTNLTRISPDDTTEFTTYRYPPFYDPDADEYDLSVTKARDLWIMGSIDNYEENIDGELTKVGDYDAYNISINPCEGLSGTDLTDCQADGPYQVLAQVYVRDFLSELQPMLVTTDTDRKLFRGYSHVGVVKDVYPDFPPARDSDDDHVFCTSQANEILGTVTFDDTQELVLMTGHGFANGARVYFSAASADISADWLPDGMGIFIPYLVDLVDTDSFRLTTTGGVPIAMTNAPAGSVANTFYIHSAEFIHLTECANGSMPGNDLYTDWVMQDYYSAYAERKGWAHNYVNYLAMGPRGYPYTNMQTVTYEDAPARDTFREYYTYETSRQFLEFELTDLSKVGHDYTLWTTFSWAKLPEIKGSAIVAEAITDYISVLDFMQTCVGNPDPDSDSGSAIIAMCTGISALTEEQCGSMCTNKVGVANDIRSYNAAEFNYPVCELDLGCTAVQELINFSNNGAVRIPPLLEPGTTMFINTAVADADHEYYQDPSLPENLMYETVDPYCEGESVSENQLGECEIDKSANMAIMSDIRQAFTTEKDRLSIYGCRHTVVGAVFDVCVDVMASHLEIKKTHNVYSWLGETLATDRPLLRYGGYVNVAGVVRGTDYPEIYERAGEIIGKPLRVHYELFDVPGNQESIVNFIVGGRKLSQGKYLFRVRVTKKRDLLP